MSPAGFEQAIPAREQPQTHSLDRAATRIDSSDQILFIAQSVPKMCIGTEMVTICFKGGPGYLSQFSDSLLAGLSGDRFPVLA